MQSLRTVSPKSEFETSTAYEERLRSAQGRSTVDVAVLVPVRESGVTYSADTQEMRIGCGAVLFNTSNVSAPGFRSIDYINVADSVHPTGTYTGATVFGARASVYRQQRNHVGLSIPGLARHGWPSSDYGGRPTAVPMNPDTARRSKNSFAVMFVGDLVPRFIETGDWHYSPTLRNPTETTLRARILMMRPTCAVLVNRDTKQVIRRY